MKNRCKEKEKVNQRKTSGYLYEEKMGKRKNILTAGTAECTGKSDCIIGINLIFAERSGMEG